MVQRRHDRLVRVCHIGAEVEHRHSWHGVGGEASCHGSVGRSLGGHGLAALGSGVGDALRQGAKDADCKVDAFASSCKEEAFLHFILAGRKNGSPNWVIHWKLFLLVGKCTI